MARVFIVQEQAGNQTKIKAICITQLDAKREFIRIIRPWFAKIETDKKNRSFEECIKEGSFTGETTVCIESHGLLPVSVSHFHGIDDVKVAMGNIAGTIMERFFEDFDIDMEYYNEMPPGTEMAWTVRENGAYIKTVKDGDDLAYWEDKVKYGKEGKWRFYLLRKGKCIRNIDPDELIEYIKENIQNA